MRFATVRLLLLTFTVLLLLGCQAQPPQATPKSPPATAPAIEPDYWPTNGWKSSTPEEQGVDSGRLAAMFEAVDQKKLNLHSVLVIRNGYLIAEAYFAPYTPETKHQLASVTKSVTGMLTGIAIDQGKIKDTAQPLLGFFPGRTVAHLDANKRAVTLDNLLSLTSGLDCSDSAGARDAMFSSPDWVQYTLDLPVTAAPGKQFRYCTPAVHLVSAVVQQGTGRSERELANDALFAPLGIPAATAQDWPSDPQGVSTGGHGLSLVPRDMAKLGYLYLHGGRWNGQQVVPQKWVTASVTPHTTEEASGRGYGYLVWLYPQGYDSMMGLGGQDIHVISDKNMVVVFTAAMDIPTHDTEAIKLLDDYIVPAARSAQPLPANPAALAQLKERIARAASPVTALPPLPALARKVSGKVYQMESNPNGWTTVSLSFTEGVAQATVSVNGVEFAVGLDNLYRTNANGRAAEAMRGHWEGDTFVVDNHLVGEAFQYQSRITFPGDQIVVEATEQVMGTKTSARGRVTP